LIRVERQGDVRLILLNRPEKRNALSIEMLEQVRDAIRGAAAGAESGVVIAGEGPSFTAGADLSEFARADRAHARRLIGVLAEMCAAARHSPKPVVCAAHGHCLGGGLELAVACDFLVAAPGTLFGMPEIAAGIPSVIDAVLIQHHVGLARARELILTGDSITAATALSWGLVNQVVERDRLLPAAAEWVHRVARHDPAAVRAQKRLFEAWLHSPLEETPRSNQETLAAFFESGEPQRVAGGRLRIAGSVRPEELRPLA